MILKTASNSHGDSVSLHVDIDLDKDVVTFFCREWRNGYSKNTLCATLKEAHAIERKVEAEILGNG